MADDLAHETALLASAVRRLKSARAALRRIEELATDTPTPADAERALDAIKAECESALSE